MYLGLNVHVGDYYYITFIGSFFPPSSEVEKNKPKINLSKSDENTNLFYTHSLNSCYV